MVSLTLITLLTLCVFAQAAHIKPNVHRARSPALAHHIGTPATHIRQRRSCAANRAQNSDPGASTSTHSSATPKNTPTKAIASGGSSGCFPALGFKTPDNVPDSLDGWWCNEKTEYAFLGFSYEVSACQSPGTLNSDFANIRYNFKGRYIRLYGACDRNGFYDDVVEAAYNNGLGVHALIWFGFDGGNKWQSRRDALFSTLHNNPKAKFVTRAVQFGSEPLLDDVLPASQLASQVQAAKDNLASLKIPVTVSDMQWSFQKNGGAGMKVLDAVDLFDAHMLPFFGGDASTAYASWSSIKNSVDNFWVPNANGRKIIFTENGWPSGVHDESQRPNSGRAQASLTQEKNYFSMLDDNCEYFKSVPGGGLGWFAHIYSDAMEEGYGILSASGQPKFDFSPRTHC